MPKWIVSVEYTDGDTQQFYFSNTLQAIECFETYAGFANVERVSINPAAEVTT